MDLVGSPEIVVDAPYIIEYRVGHHPDWLGKYVQYLAYKFGPQGLLKLEGTTPFKIFIGDGLRRIVFSNEQEYTMFLLKWD